MNNYPSATDNEIARLTALLSTPNLSQANIDELNTQLQALLVKKRGGEKTGQVWLDERK